MLRICAQRLTNKTEDKMLSHLRCTQLDKY